MLNHSGILCFSKSQESLWWKKSSRETRSQGHNAHFLGHHSPRIQSQWWPWIDIWPHMAACVASAENSLPRCWWRDPAQEPFENHMCIICRRPSWGVCAARASAGSVWAACCAGRWACCASFILQFHTLLLLILLCHLGSLILWPPTRCAASRHCRRWGSRELGVSSFPAGPQCGQDFDPYIQPPFSLASWSHPTPVSSAGGVIGSLLLLVPRYVTSSGWCSLDPIHPSVNSSFTKSSLLTLGGDT